MTETLKKILNTHDPKEIEQMAKTLSLEEVSLLLEHIERGEFQIGTLPFIHGLPMTHFAVFSNAPFFQKFAKTPLVQKKIQELVPHFNFLFSQFSEEEKILAECINELPLFPIPSNIFNSICDQIVQITDKTATAIQLLDQVLKLSWLSERAELVEAFSDLKNHFLTLKQQEMTHSTLLLKRVNSIFGSDNKASSIDGLRALGINYVEDLKLLSSILGDDLSDLPSNSLLPAIHDRLNSAGLSTIGDLREHHIFTKEHLFAFLKKTD